MKTTTKLICALLVFTMTTLLAFSANGNRGPRQSPTPKPSPTPRSTPNPNRTYALADLQGQFSFRLVPAESFSPFFNGQNGAPDSGINTAPRQDILRVGVITFDGQGNVTGHALATTDNGLTTVPLDFNFSGTYTINPDGTGTLSVTPTSGNISVPGEGTVEGLETYSIVINTGLGGGRATVDLAETDNDGGGAKIFLTGKAVSRFANAGAGREDD